MSLWHHNTIQQQQQRHSSDDLMRHGALPFAVVALSTRPRRRNRFIRQHIATKKASAGNIHIVCDADDTPNSKQIVRVGRVHSSASSLNKSNDPSMQKI